MRSRGYAPGTCPRSTLSGGRGAGTRSADSARRPPNTRTPWPNSGKLLIWGRTWRYVAVRFEGWNDEERDHERRTLLRRHAIQPFALFGLLLSVAALAGCGGIRFGNPAATNSAAARDLFETHVEEQLGAAWMSNIYDHDSFRKGAQDFGDTACRNARAGLSRDDFQKNYLETAHSAANAGGSAAAQPDSVLNAQSLMFWSLAMRDLCPSVGGTP